MINKIIIKGAREHNLKGIDLELPKNKLIVFTGVSGSGKSSLAFDTLFAEGQRRYVESLSSYARQFLGIMKKPSVDYIEGLSPAISIDQKSASHNPRSTVGTVTEIYDYLRLLFAKIGTPHCPTCGETIKSTTVDQMIDIVLEWPEKSRIQIFAPIIRGKKGEYLKLLNDIYNEGYTQAKINGKFVRLDEKIQLSRYKIHIIDILVSEIKISAENIKHITDAVEQAIKLTDGIVKIINLQTKEEKTLNQSAMCASCGITFPELEPRLFSFNSPYGACEKCNGLGIKQEIDPELIIPDKNKTISEGAIMPYNYHQGYYGSLIRALATKLGYQTHTRITNWSKEDINYLMFGGKKIEKIKLAYFGGGHTNSFYINFNGLINLLERRYGQTDSNIVREQLEKYMKISPCPDCDGCRLKKDPLLVTIGNDASQKNIAQISKMSVGQNLEWFSKINLTAREQLISEKIIAEINNRLNFLANVGLDYLSIDRSANTLSGGETQRIRLASQIGSALTGVLYVLDEPSVGLHAKDQKKLIDILIKLKEIGNTVIAVEHDEQTINSADYIVDIGPGAGANGGKIVAKGRLQDIISNNGSLTGQYLSGKKYIEIPKKRKIPKGKFITIIGAAEHNLKNLTVHFPIGVFTCVTGVSGSGKSTLVNDILYKSVNRKINKSNDSPGKHYKIEGHEHIKRIIDINQSPIGRTPRSNPATYTGVFTHIRELFALTKDAKIHGYGAGRFSFNVYGGRCETCKGDGLLKIQMQFLPDVYIPCDTCRGRRYNRETLEIKFKNKNIAQVLDMSVDEALSFFINIPRVADKLKLLSDIGLGYIKLGQSATTLSGGEAQRIKLASELAKTQHGKNLYILDEPTTGLHFSDVEKLLNILNKLVNAGNTVIVIEHNMDVIKVADHIIDLGPEGGDAGGKIVALGTPEDIAVNKKSYTGLYLKKFLI